MAEADNSAEQFRDLLRERSKLTDALIAPLTRTGYRYDWLAFVRFCERMNLTALPATTETLSLYVAERLAAGRKTSTVARNIGAIAQRHRAENLTSPVSEDIWMLLRGARRLREEQLEQVRPLTIEEVRAIANRWGVEDTPIAIRNRAVILVGFASALRSANLVQLTLADVEFCKEGARLRIGREKNDQETVGRLIGVPHGKYPETCPIAAVRAWIARRGAFAGPLFTALNGRSVVVPLAADRITRIVQQAVAAIGVPDPSAYGSHSLRSGFVTEAGQNGASELQIAAQTGHRDMATLRRYLRPRDIFRANACGWLGL